MYTYVCVRDGINRLIKTTHTVCLSETSLAPGQTEGQGPELHLLLR